MTATLMESWFAGLDGPQKDEWFAVVADQTTGGVDPALWTGGVVFPSLVDTLLPENRPGGISEWVFDAIGPGHMISAALADFLRKKLREQAGMLPSSLDGQEPG